MPSILATPHALSKASNLFESLRQTEEKGEESMQAYFEQSNDNSQAKKGEEENGTANLQSPMLPLNTEDSIMSITDTRNNDTMCIANPNMRKMMHRDSPLLNLNTCLQLDHNAL